MEMFLFEALWNNPNPDVPMASKGDTVYVIHPEWLTAHFGIVQKITLSASRPQLYVEFDDGIVQWIDAYTAWMIGNTVEQFQYFADCLDEASVEWMSRHSLVNPWEL